MKFSLILILLFETLINISLEFNPLSFENRLINEITKRIGTRLERVPSESLSHEEIFRRGLKRSLIKYLNDVHSTNININDSNLSISQLYTHFYGRQCKIGIEHLLKNVFEPLVASVDLQDSTKDDPIVHFDADLLIESNSRVKNITNTIIALVNTSRANDLKTARELTAKVLHTIQDFYSHSNWVDLGHKEINWRIGSDDFKVSDSPKNESNCLDNCEKITIPCPDLISAILPADLKCPIDYWKCLDNIDMTNNVLTSGYYSNQKLSDGTLVLKPRNKQKCSHGGILDSTGSTLSSFGGLNKDSPYYILSPKAHLHAAAADLAIKHTERYFNFLREKFGDANFSKFLRLDPNEDLLNKLCSLFSIV